MRAYGINRIAAHYSVRHGSRYSEQRELARRALKKSERQMANKAVRNFMKGIEMTSVAEHLISQVIEGTSQVRLTQVKTLASSLGGTVTDDGTRAVAKLKSSDDVAAFINRATAMKLITNRGSGNSVVVPLGMSK